MIALWDRIAILLVCYNSCCLPPTSLHHWCSGWVWASSHEASPLEFQGCGVSVLLSPLNIWKEKKKKELLEYAVALWRLGAPNDWHPERATEIPQKNTSSLGGLCGQIRPFSLEERWSVMVPPGRSGREQLQEPHSLVLPCPTHQVPSPTLGHCDHGSLSPGYIQPRRLCG